MAFSVSPSIDVREFDASLVIPNISSIISGMVGKFIWGPCFERKQVTSEVELLKYFGVPTSSNYKDFFSAAEYLRYNTNLYIVRAVDANTAKNAGLGVLGEGVGITAAISTNPYIPNADSIPTISFGAQEKLQIVARYPGSNGNTKIKVALANADDFETAQVVTGTYFNEVFDFAPQSSVYDKYDQIAIVVLVKNILNDNYEIAEKWLVDMDPEAKDSYNKSNYIENIINTKSQYIYVFDNTSIALSPESFTATLLAGGVDGDPSTGDINLGYDYFANAEEFDVNIIFDAANTNVIVQQYIVDMVEDRKDCVGVLCIPDDELLGVDIATAIANAVTYKETTLGETTNRCVIIGNVKYIYDKYNDTYRWVPLSGDVAGLITETARLYEIWFPSDGIERGKIRNVLKFAINPNKTYRDTLYRKSINPTIIHPTMGTILFGQKTMTMTPSAFDRLNVRLLFITIEKSISTFARAFLFQLNTEYYRNYFKSLIISYLTDIKGRQGIEDFKVICDTTNNTPEVIANNQFVGDIYVKPTYAIEYIQLNFTAVGTGVSFEEIIRR